MASSLLDSAAPLLSEVYGGLLSVWVELCFLIFFPLGFAFFQRHKSCQVEKRRKKVIDSVAPTSSFDKKILGLMEAEASAGRPAGVLEAWRSCNDRAPTPQDRIPMVAQALLSESPETTVEELVTHIQRHVSSLCNVRTSMAILDVIARSGNMKALTDTCHSLQQNLCIPFNSQVYEIILGGHAAVGDEESVRLLFIDMREAKVAVSARGHSLVIKGFLKSGKCDAVLVQMRAMKNQGFVVPSFAMAQLLRVACEKGDGERIFETMIADSVTPSEDCISVLLDYCLKRGNNHFAARVEAVARSAMVPLNASSCVSLLRLAISAADTRALGLFEELRSLGDIPKGVCMSIVSSCAEVKFQRLAEAVVAYVRSSGGMSVTMYSALMKVYAYCGLYDKACDIYEAIITDGLEPDAAMYGCLLKFSVECGRTDLSRKLAERCPAMEIQSYMSLIRAAGRDRDIDSAFALLERLEVSGIALDLPVYNCVLDVCVNVGDLDRAGKLVEKMKRKERLDIISYNTLLKGYCRTDFARALALLDDMRADDVTPNDVTYNCLINAAVNSGNMKEAWRLLASMEQYHVKVDHYTVSIIMKSLRKTRNPTDLKRAFELLEHVDVCADEILLNSVLETCLSHKEFHRLDDLLRKFEASALRPAMHTYGTLIRAAGVINDCPKCWQLWRHMIESRGVAPNEVVLGCMLEALVSNGLVDAAEELMISWKGQVKHNSIMYSTLAKGYSMRRDAASALRLWHQCREEGVKMSNTSFNCFIDSQARVGAMEEALSIMEAMGRSGNAPDAITFASIIKGFCMKGDLDRALEFFQSMQAAGQVKDVVVYNSLLEACARGGHTRLAEVLVHDLDAFKIQPLNSTTLILVKMYGRCGHLEKALEYAGKWSLMHNLKPDAIVQTALISACLQNHALDKALFFFEALKASGQADSKCYAAMVIGLRRMGECAMARKFVDEAAAAGCSLEGDLSSQVGRGNQKCTSKVGRY